MSDLTRVVPMISATTGIPVYVKPLNIMGMRAVSNGQAVRLSYWDGGTVLVKGSVPVVCDQLFNHKYWKASRETQVPTAEWQEKTCFEW